MPRLGVARGPGHRSIVVVVAARAAEAADEVAEAADEAAAGVDVAERCNHVDITSKQVEHESCLR